MTPEERVEAIFGDPEGTWGYEVDWHSVEPVVLRHIRAAENDALERAALEAEAYASDEASEIARDIRVLKHEPASS
jgi:hypothetical protein